MDSRIVLIIMNAINTIIFVFLIIIWAKIINKQIKSTVNEYIFKPNKFAFVFGIFWMVYKRLWKGIFVFILLNLLNMIISLFINLLIIYLTNFDVSILDNTQLTWSIKKPFMILEVIIFAVFLALYGEKIAALKNFKKNKENKRSGTAGFFKKIVDFFKMNISADKKTENRNSAQEFIDRSKKLVKKIRRKK